MFSHRVPVNKSISPEHIHDLEGYKRNITPALEPVMQSASDIKTLKDKKILRKLEFSPNPLSESSLIKYKKKLPELGYSKNSSKFSSKNYKIRNSSNNSFIGSPSNISDTIKAENIYQEKLFSPYSWNDYKKIKPKKYVLLGGLGPNMGHENWKLANEKKQKMINYWRVIKEKNYSVG